MTTIDITDVMCNCVNEGRYTLQYFTTIFVLFFAAIFVNKALFESYKSDLNYNNHDDEENNEDKVNEENDNDDNDDNDDDDDDDENGDKHQYEFKFVAKKKCD
jgi:hypothetical protein